MKLRLFVAMASLAIFATAVQPASAADANADAIDSCVKTGQNVKSGKMTGVDATGMIQCNGGSGAGSSVKLYLNYGPQNGGTQYAGEVAGGDHLNVFFSGGFAYVTSALHSGVKNDPSTCEQCYNLMLVQKLSTRENADAPGPLLVDHGIDIIRLSDSVDYKKVARDGYFKAQRNFGNGDIRSAKLLKAAAPAR